MNRQQRRRAERDPRVKAVSERFATDFTEMTMQLVQPFLDAHSQGKDVPAEELLSKEALDLCKARGEQLADELKAIFNPPQKPTPVMTFSKNMQSGPRVNIR